MDVVPSLDSWTTLFLLAAAQGVFLALVLFIARPGLHGVNRWLAGFLLCFSITLLDYVGFWSGYHYYFPFLAGIYLPLAFLMGPLLYLYIRKKVFPAADWWPGKWLHFLPAFATLCWRLPVFLLPSSTRRKWFAGGPEQMYEAPPDIFSMTNLVGLLIIGQLVFYAFKIRRCIKEEYRQIQAGRIKLTSSFQKWSRLLNGLYLGFIAGYIAYYLLLNTPYFNIFQDYTIAVAMSICIYGIGYAGFARPDMLSSLPPQGLSEEPKYRHSTLTPGASQSLADKLLEYMEEKQPFLDNELRLSGLARQLEVSKHHLSQVINEQMGKHFSEFVNEYRVRKAQQMLLDPEKRKWPVIEIAYAAGFNNKTSFYQSFKSLAGCSPSDFRRRARQKTN